LTHLIDDVARAMTGAAPQAGMREAVLARIEHRAPARLLWVAAPIAAAALVVLAVGLRNAGTNPGDAPLVPTTAQTSPVAGAGPDMVAGDSTPATGSAVRSRRQAASLPQIRTIPALKEPVALTGARIQPDALSVPLLQLRPLVTEPIAIRVIADDSGGRE
jgi:hypothetical protein